MQKVPVFLRGFCDQDFGLSLVYADGSTHVNALTRVSGAANGVLAT
jgi:hypothetical protein